MGRWARSMWLALIILAPSILLGEKVKDLPKPTAYVTDTAGVLSESSQIEINQLCGEVERQAHAQIAVVIIKSLEDRPVEDFANDLFHTWKIGINNAQQGRDRGVLLLFATQDRKRRIEVGYGLEGILPDAKAGDIGRAMVPYLRQNQWDDAVKLGVNQIGQLIAADAGVQLQSIQPAHRYRRENVPQKLGAGGYIVGILVLLFIIFIIFAVIRSIFRGGGGRGGGGGIGGWLPWFLLGNLLGGGGRGWGDSGRRDWGGGGGGWGGDSGGDSSGGFGGFGGGDSGGGGASGDW